MVPAIPFLFVAVFFGIGLFVLYNALDGVRTVYHILTNDPVPVRDLATRAGPVEIEGTATTDDDQTVQSPFSGTRCLAYEYEVEEYRSSGKHNTWQTVDEGGDAVSFLVEDETGTVRVDPTGAELHCEDETVRVDGGTEPPERIAQFIDSTDEVDSQQKTANLLVTELNYGNDQKFVERRLDAGEDVYVYGEATRASAGGGWGSGLVDALVGDGDRTPVFVVSDTSERGTALRIGRKALASCLFALVWLGVSLLAFLVIF